MWYSEENNSMPSTGPNKKVSFIENGSSQTDSLFIFEVNTFSEMFVSGQENSVIFKQTQQSISYEWSICAWLADGLAHC
jgi:hypothetical protein